MLALPIIGGMVSQNVLNLVDTAMVGSLGDAAIAAVGLGGFANFLATAFITGLSAGVQAMASRRLGEGKVGETAVPLNGGLLMVLAIALPWSALLIWLAPALYPYLNDDPAVMAAGVPYLQWRLVGAVALGVNFAFRGYWSGINKSGFYLRTLLIMHVTNIVLNYLLIFGKFGFPELGAVGSGVATTIAAFVGTGAYIALGWKEARGAGFLRGLPSADTMRAILRTSVPSGLQSAMFAAGITAQMWILGQIGTAEVAAANVLINLTLVALLPGLGLGIAAAALVGQALGRKDAADAARWGWDVSKVGVVTLACLGAPMLLAPDLLLAPFLRDPQTLELARGPLQLVGATIALDAIGMVLMNALVGAGATRSVMRVAVIAQWAIFLPAAYLIGPVLGYGLLAVWALNIAYRLGQAGAFAWLWHRGAWASIRL